jgi:hypothetical protein
MKIANLLSSSSRRERVIYLPIVIDQEVVCTLQGLETPLDGAEEMKGGWRWYLETIERICGSLTAVPSTTSSLVVSNECISLFQTFAEQMLLPVSGLRLPTPTTATPTSDYFSSLIELLSLSLAPSGAMDIGIIFERQGDESDGSRSEEEDEADLSYACYVLCHDSLLNQLSSHR